MITGSVKNVVNKTRKRNKDVLKRGLSPFMEIKKALISKQSLYVR
ncbi:MAG: hypothetical protein JWM92_444 [Candidatus Nomurabacteria bacterium]|nr:hypothetical protein [Candidatus Nomurabacteria bacterium]